MALLKVSNVSKSYDGRKIIDNINLELNKGEIVSLLGVSGVGKTTVTFSKFLFSDVAV